MNALPRSRCSGAVLLLFGALVLVIVVEIKLAVRMARSRLIPALQENDRSNDADARMAGQAEKKPS